MSADPSNRGPNPYAPPASTAQATFAEPTPNAVPATFGPRFLARLIDFVVHFVVSMIAGFAGGVSAAFIAAAGGLPEGWQARMQEVSILSFVIGFVASTLYHTLAEAFGGATVGKAILGLRVRSADLSPATFRGALIRSLAILIDGLFFGRLRFACLGRFRSYL